MDQFNAIISFLLRTADYGLQTFMYPERSRRAVFDFERSRETNIRVISLVDDQFNAIISFLLRTTDYALPTLNYFCSSESALNEDPGLVYH